MTHPQEQWMEERPEQVVLEFGQVGVAKIVSSSFKRDMKANVWEELGGQLGASLSAYLLSNTIHRSVKEEGRYPINLWNHLLASIPWVRRWAKMKRVEEVIEFTHVCPHLEWPDRNEQKVHFAFMKSPLHKQP